YITPPCGSIHSAVWDLTSTNDTLPPGLSPGSVDIVILVFVLSALHPDEWASAIRNVHRVLKPGTGRVLFRDYGRYDLTQLRFKTGRMMGDNFYKRGDGTRVYFLELDELSLLFTGKRLSAEERNHANSGANLTQLIDDDDGDPGENSITVPPTKEIDQALSIHPNLLDPSFPFSRSSNQRRDTNDLDLDDQHRTLRQHPLFTIVNLGVDRRLIVNRKRQLKMYRVWMQGIFQSV
ncbi:hypothetical protein C8R42DRAFT_596500, partial [Lentinula raphanica]